MREWSELGDCARLVNTAAVEPRDYQINIARSVFTGRNTLVILPTGLGKTLIAVFAIANAIASGKRALILAPTKPLSEQHHKSLEALLNIDKENILLLTGSVSAKQRRGLVKSAKVIAATPQTISNDLKAGRMSLEDFGVVIFDECHKAAGRYAYTYIAEECSLNGVQLIGLTASPGSKKEKVDALIKALNIQNIEIRMSSDPDVERYVFGKEVTTIHVDKNMHIDTVLGQLKPVITEHLETLYKYGLSPFKDFERMPKGRLLQIGDNIKKLQAKNYKFMALFNYVYVLDLVHAYDLAATEGLYPFVSYIESLRNREQKSRVVLNILNNKNVVAAEWSARQALEAGGEHPKMFKVIEMIGSRYTGKSVIIFAQYRSTIKKLVDVLNKNGISARAFVGKKEGVTNASQAQVIQDFRDNKFKVLVATSIGEEGLDIPSVDVVIFYEPVASEIRNIQRKGRAGRIRYGEVMILVTKGTKDETYHMIAKMKEKKMHDLVLRIKKQLEYGNAGAGRNVLEDGQRRLA
ncbi:MAG: DEAD/DEAH box helicase [Candidatus Micrarchaeales archaeon]|nr:DEAD/DEAH box helicase [Candidatus Micrarchaeales archaeon]